MQSDGRGDAGRQSVLVAEEDLERARFEILWRETSDRAGTFMTFAASPGETILKGVSTTITSFAITRRGKNGRAVDAVADGRGSGGRRRCRGE